MTKKFYIITFLTVFISQYTNATSSNNNFLGKRIYESHCAICHHKERIGIAGPPLIPAFLRKYNLKELTSMIKDGFPQTLMPKYNFLDKDELLAVAEYIKSPVDKI